MKKRGNGLPETCVQNLVSIVRGEVAYERVKGIDGDLVDDPIALIEEEAAADAEQEIEIFEPRVEVDDIQTVGQSDHGSLDFNISIHRKEETDES